MKKIDSKDSFLWAAARRRDFADIGARDAEDAAAGTSSASRRLLRRQRRSSSRARGEREFAEARTRRPGAELVVSSAPGGRRLAQRSSG